MIKRSPNRILLIGGRSFLLGIILACCFSKVFSVSLAAIFLELILLIIFYRQDKLFVALIFILGVLLGGYRFQTSLRFWQKQKIPKTILLQTTLKQPPLIKHNSQQIIIPPVVVSLPRYPVYLPGDVIKIQGKSSFLKKWRIIDSSFVSFRVRYPKIHLIKSHYWSFRRISYWMKNRAALSLQRVIPQPDSGLITAIILGDKTALSSSLLKQIRKTGLSYIIVVSGLHLVIMAKIISTLLLTLGMSKKRQLIWSLLTLLLFIYLIGPSPSIIRAGIMSLLLIVGELNYRQYSSSRALWLAAIIMLGINPLIIESLSFQLSFLATAGIVYINPLLKNIKVVKCISSSKPGQWLMLYFLPSLSAFLAVTPWLFYQIGTISLLAPLVSLFVIPVIPTLMVGGWLVIVSANLNYYLALFIGFFLRGISHFLLLVIRTFSFFPLSQVTISSSWRWLIFPYYILLIAICFIYYYRQRFHSNLDIINE